jgi:nucleoside-diphosphate-sugar epimerase
MIFSSTAQPAALHKGILILGGSGFIGTRLTAELQKRREHVRIGDLNQSKAFPQIWAHCDVRRGETLVDLFRQVDAVINLAAEHRDDVRPISRYHETNVKGAEQVCQAAREVGISKIIFTSSVAVYGFPIGRVDEAGPFVPFNPYGQTKLEAEGIYRAWAEEDPTRSLVIVRPAVVFGEGNRGNVYNLLHQIATGKFLMVGSGTNVKSMAYVENVAAFLAHLVSMGSGVHIFNYVDGPDMNTNTLVRHIFDSLGKSSKMPPPIPELVALAGATVLDGLGRLTGRTFPISAIRVRKFCESTQFQANRVTEIGFTPPYSLRDGLDRTVRFEFSAK